MGRLVEKVAIVAGGGRGIGRAIARGYSQKGRMLLLRRSIPIQVLKRLARYKRSDGAVFSFRTDISCKHQIDTLITRVVQEFDKIDTFGNNAGIHISSSFLHVSEEIYDRTLNTNPRGPFFCSQAVDRFIVDHRRIACFMIVLRRVLK